MGEYILSGILFPEAIFYLTGILSTSDNNKIIGNQSSEDDNEYQI